MRFVYEQVLELCDQHEGGALESAHRQVWRRLREAANDGISLYEAELEAVRERSARGAAVKRVDGGFIAACAEDDPDRIGAVIPSAPGETGGPGEPGRPWWRFWR